MDQINLAVEDLDRTQEVDVEHFLELAIHNMAFFLCFGKTFEKNHKIIKELRFYDAALLTFFELNAVGVFFPWAKDAITYLPKFKQVSKGIERMAKLISEEIEEHHRTLDENNPRDFTDYFLLEMRKSDDNDFTMPVLVGEIKSLLLSATDTTRTSLAWFLLLMAKYPEIQESIHREMDSNVGRNKRPELEDKSNLPLLEASILESMRFRYIMNLNAPRRVLWDTTLCGYDIPKDTIVFHSFFTHSLKSEFWTDPYLFDPHRFLSPDGKYVQVPEHFFPFSYGKRICVGEKIAKCTMFLVAAMLIQKFRILPPVGGVNLQAKVNFMNSPEHPFVKFVVRD